MTFHGFEDGATTARHATEASNEKVVDALLRHRLRLESRREGMDCDALRRSALEHWEQVGLLEDRVVDRPPDPRGEGIHELALHDLAPFHDLYVTMPRIVADPGKGLADRGPLALDDLRSEILLDQQEAGDYREFVLLLRLPRDLADLPGARRRVRREVESREVDQMDEGRPFGSHDFDPPPCSADLRRDDDNGA